jgi:hypothetical protein
MSSTPGRITRRFFPSVALIGLVLLAAFQLRVLFLTYAEAFSLRLWDLRFKTAVERSALLQGGDVAGFVDFLRENVPEDARLILPPNYPLRPFAHIGYMQYYLFPRDIENCGYDEVNACIRRVTGPNTYIMALPDFPPRALAEESKRFIPFTDDMGVYAPR